MVLIDLAVMYCLIPLKMKSSKVQTLGELRMRGTANG